MKRSRVFRGFTLVELMVVVIIVAVLAALVVPKLINKVDEAKVKAAQADLKTISGLLQNFRVDCDRFPTTEEGLPALTTAPSDLQGKWKGPYPDKPIAKDPWGNDYHYTCPGQGGPDTYDLYSDGQTGQNSPIYYNPGGGS